MRRKAIDALLKAACYGAAAVTFGALLFLIVFIVVKGVPFLTPSLFALKYNSENVSLLPSLFTTVYAVVLALLTALPVGGFTAVYLVEYAKRGSKLVSLIRVASETLAGIPSIVYGLFGMLFFVTRLKFGFSLLAGAFTLAIMILPLIIRTTEEALLSVPDTYREGAFGLGAGRLRVVFRVVLPAAAPGVLAGVILATGRVVGETAALVFTASTVAQFTASPMNSMRTLAVHMYVLSGEGLYTGQAYATAVVLLAVVAVINAASSYLAKRVTEV